MSKLPLLLAALTVGLLTACSAGKDDPTSTSQDNLSAPEKAVSGPQVCAHTTENACLADEGCAWGDQGKGPSCFWVGRVDAQPGDPGFPQPEPQPEPELPGAEPAGPTVCSHNTTESACLADPGCAWGDQGDGPSCFYVGEVVPYAP